jgi:penicillin-binding protein 2
MKKITITTLLLLVLVLTACSASAPQATPTPVTTPTPAPTPTLAQPEVTITRPDAPDTTVGDFLDAWKLDNYAQMYSYLDIASQSAISEEAFIERYLDAMIEAAIGIGQVEYEVLESRVLSPVAAEVRYRVTLKSALFDPFLRDYTASLTKENDAWRIAWHDGLVLPELAGGNQFRIINLIPKRGDIYDRNNDPLVTDAGAYALGLVPAEFNLDKEGDMLNILARASGYPTEYIFSLYAPVGYTADYYIPFTSVSEDNLNRYYNAVTSYPGVYVNYFEGRYYVDEGIAPQTVGYVSAIQPEEVDAFRRQGYQWTERVGRAGLERWAQNELVGQRGGRLFLDDAAGNQLQLVTAVESIGPSASITTTLDTFLQKRAQQALFGFRGAVVVMERDTGRVLAMASAPGFDANLFAPNNYNNAFASPFFDANNPLFNRAVEGQYPLGSVFKIISMAAALEEGLYGPNDTYDCQYTFTELGNPTLYDWTYERNQRDPDEEVPPSGVLTLQQGLMRSCNPWFYHIGLRFYEENNSTAISEMARGFGLGQPTGVEFPQEASGNIPDPTEKLDATNISIGQGGVLVTPLQVARFVAAVGNGGTLYKPHLIEQITANTGQVLYQFEPEVAGTLPISPENLEYVQEAMRMVVRDPRGTAYRIMGAFVIDIYGKTGTAETGAVNPHAWYVVYTDEGREDKPDIAIAVVVENIGEGSDYGAPIALRMLRSYYDFNIGRFPWEERIGVPLDLLPPEEDEDDGEQGLLLQDMTIFS